MSSDTATKLWDDNINRLLFQLTHSQNVTDAFGGLLAIGTHIDPEFVSFHDMLTISQRNL